MRIDNNCKYLINKVDCVSISIHKACQKALLLLSSNKASVHIQNLIIIGAKYMAVIYGKGITAVNLNVNSYLFWSQITILDVSSTDAQFNDLIWIDPAV